MSNILHDQTTTVARPCPDWCELPAGHGWDSEDPGIVYRHHEQVIGSVDDAHCWVAIETLEGSASGGPSTFTPVVITVGTRVEGAELNAEQAIEFADLLRISAAVAKQALFPPAL